VRVLQLAATLLLAAAPVAAQGTVSGGNGTLYLAARPGRILIVDEATFRVTGEIPLAKSRPGMSYPLQLSRDRKRFLSYGLNLEDIEIVDIAARKVVETVTLSEGNKKVRLDCYDGCGEHRTRLAVGARSTTKLVDRFEIGPKALVEYDLDKKKVGRTIPWPKDEEEERTGLIYSPDGKLLYVLAADDVFVYDTANLEVVDKWELSRPVEHGFGRLEVASTTDVNDEPGFFTGIFEVDDPVQHRRMMGIARFDLAGKKVDFWTVGPAKPLRQFALAPGRKKGYSILEETNNWELWTFDLEGRHLEKRTPMPTGRPRMSLSVSSNGKVLYVFGAGNTIDLYDAQSHRFLRTVTLDAEVGWMFVLPPGS
jgi:hypothetical protein